MKKPNKKLAEKRGSRSIKLTFPERIDIIRKVKTLPDVRYYNIDGKEYWTTPLEIGSLELLEQWKFDIAGPLGIWKAKQEKKKITVPELNFNLPKHLVPRKYQIEGVKYILEHNNRALIADEMGIGKTIQALLWMKLNPQLKPFIVVCPTIAKYNWVAEIEKWLPEYSVKVLNGRKFQKEKLKESIIILNYEILANKREKKKDRSGRKKSVAITNTGWVDYLLKYKPKGVVFDEIHYAKSTKSARGKDSLKLAKKMIGVVGLSGTPIENGPIDFFNILQIIKPGLFRNYMDYGKTYCDGKNNGFGWSFKGASNLDKLHEILTKNCMIRRTKREVLPELPQLTRTVIPVDLTNRQEYNYAFDNFGQWLSNQTGFTGKVKTMALQKIEKLKQLVIKGKMKGIFEWVDNFLFSDQKLVLFCTHKKTIEELMKRYKHSAVMVDGSVTGKKRMKCVNDFQNDKRVRLFIANLKAGGVAITLTEASNVATVELGWKGSEHDQADDRIVRFGQKAKSLNAWYLLAKDTIEIDIAHLQDKKRKNVDKILEGKETEKDELLIQLINKIKEAK